MQLVNDLDLIVMTPNAQVNNSFATFLLQNILILLVLVIQSLLNCHHHLQLFGNSVDFPDTQNNVEKAKLPAHLSFLEFTRSIRILQVVVSPCAAGVSIRIAG